MHLLADCGNTNVKLALVQDGRITAMQRLAPQTEQLTAFLAAQLLPATSALELVLLPGSRRNSETVRTWWQQVGRGRRRDIGLDIPVPDLGQYPGIGLDRVVAGIAAIAAERTPVIVIDAGTATTIGAWGCAPDTYRPRFLGGLILPGARTAIAGLAALAPALPAVEPLGPESEALQHSTPGAIAAAMGIGYGPMVAACLIKLERETRIRRILATGGDTGLLVDSDVIKADAVRPDLVLQGMLALADG